LVARSVALGSRALRSRARRRRASHALLGALRWRPAPLHRPPLRGGAGEGDHAPDVAPLSVERPGRLSDAGATGADLEAARRPADPAPGSLAGRVRRRGARVRDHFLRAHLQRVGLRYREELAGAVLLGNLGTGLGADKRRADALVPGRAIA